MLSATKRECVKFFDLNLRQDFYTMEVISQSLIHSNIVKLNEDELGVLSKLSPVKGSDEAIVDDLIKRFKINLVALTLGERGSRVNVARRQVCRRRLRRRGGGYRWCGRRLLCVMVIGYLRDWSLSRISRAANGLGGLFVQNQAPRRVCLVIF